MNSPYTRLVKSLLAIFVFFSLPATLKAQTTLVTGDIAFTGYISNDPVLPDQFSFVLLKNISTNTVIKFTDYGWRGTAFGSGINLESEITFTAGSNFTAGTEITIDGTTAKLVGGGLAGTIVYSGGPFFLAGNLSLSSVGDQLFAYQGTFAAPAFISGIHMNVYTIANGDPTNTDASNWDGVLAGIYLNSNTSEKPATLSTGTNAIWIGTTGDINSDRDNGHFICGPDVSTAALARAAINNQANWFTSNATAGFTLPTGCNYLFIFCESVTLSSAAGTDAQTVCNNTAITNITYTTTGATGATISGLPTGVNGSWLANVVTISGSPTITGTFNYTITLTGGICGGITTSGTITVNDVTGGTVAADQTICSGGDPAAFTESVPSTGSGVLTYQWQNSTTSCGAGFSNIAGATSSTYDAPSGVVVTTYYRRVTSSTLNSVACTANSNCITVTVNDVTGGTVGSDQTICSGGDPAIFTQTVASTGSGTLTYQWQSSTTGCGSGFSNIVGATGTTYDAPSGLTLTTYYRRVTSSTLNSVVCTANSNCITVTVNDVTGGTVAADQAVCSGGDPTGFTQTIASTGSGALTYQWQSSITSCAAGFGNIVGATSATYDAPAGLTVVTYYRRLTTSTLNAVQCTANSNCITVSITPDNTITLTSAPPTTNQTVLINTPITNITYATTGATGATVTGLPAGVTGNWAGNVVTISGTPTVQGTFPYTVTLTGGCGVITTNGTITVIVCSITLTSAAGTDAQTVCNNSPIANITYATTGATGATFSGLPAGVTGTWAANVVTISGSPSAFGTFPYIVTPTGGGCSGSITATGTITVNPIPDAVATPASQTICSAGSITTIVLSGAVSGTTFNWTRDNTVSVTGIAASGSGNISGALTNTTNAPVTVTFTITPTANGCPGTPITATVLVNPTPDAVATPASQTICSAGTITTIVLSGAVSGTTFNWTRDNTVSVTGIAASGSGNISGALTNTTNAPVTVTFTITPTANGCPGTPITATVLVNPTPDAVATPASQTICSAGTITTIVLSGAVSGTTFNWTRDNTVSVTGIAASGSGNISGALTNTTNAPVTVTFTITPTANGCPGAPITATVLVNPTPNAVATPASQTICSGLPMTTIVFTGNVTGTTYNWTRDNQVNVTGIPNSGSGNISGTPINNTVVQQTVTFTITPTANGCPGTPITATLIVNKAPTITCPANITVNNSPGVCGANVTYPPATATGSPVPVITYSQASGTFFRVGTTTVTCTATNICGTVSCTFTITVVDNEPPVITCPANITVNNTPNLCSAVVNYPLPTATDNCCLPGAVSLTQTASQTPVAGSVACNAGGFHTNNSYWRAYDLSTICLSGPLTVNTVQFGIELADANGTGTTQPITIRVYRSAGAFPGGVRTLLSTEVVNVPDQTLSLFNVTLTTPAVFATTDIMVLELFSPDGRAPANNRFFIGSNASAQTGPSYISAADCGIPNPTNLATLGFPNMHIILNANGVTAGPNPITQIAGLPSGSAFPVGVTTNTFRATDAAGNTSTCSFTVTVVDNQPPTVSCPANIVRNTDPGVCTATITVPDPTTSDNCAVTQVTWVMTGATTGSSPATGINYIGTRTFNLNGTTGQGVTTITYTVKDPAGNSATCSFTVTVNDASIPVIGASGQPTNQTVCAGTNAIFSVTASVPAGNPLNYQWQAWNGTAWVDITGATASTLTLSAVTFSMNTSSYRCKLTGRCSEVISGFATLYVNPLPTISLLASRPLALLPGQSLNITAIVSPGGGSYQWFKNGIAITGATSSSITNLSVSDIGAYRCRYTDLNGCVSISADMVVSGQVSDNLYIYPNPNSGHFHVRVYNQANEEITVRVFDMKGSLVYLKKVVTTLAYTDIEVELMSDRITAGETYLVTVNGSGGRLIGSKKIQILK